MAGNKPSIKKTRKLKSPTNAVEYFFVFVAFFPLVNNVSVVFRRHSAEWFNTNVKRSLNKISNAL